MPTGKATVNVQRTNGQERSNYSMTFQANGAGAVTESIIPGGLGTVSRVSGGRHEWIIPSGILGPIFPSDSGYVEGRTRRCCGFGCDLILNQSASPGAGARAFIQQINLQADGTTQVVIRSVDNGDASADITARVSVWIAVEER